MPSYQMEKIQDPHVSVLQLLPDFFSFSPHQEYIIIYLYIIDPSPGDRCSKYISPPLELLLSIHCSSNSLRAKTCLCFGGVDQSKALIQRLHTSAVHNLKG